jgi:hypothetical protein
MTYRSSFIISLGHFYLRSLLLLYGVSFDNTFDHNDDLQEQIDAIYNQLDEDGSGGTAREIERDG